MHDLYLAAGSCFHQIKSDILSDNTTTPYQLCVNLAFYLHSGAVSSLLGHNCVTRPPQRLHMIHNHYLWLLKGQIRGENHVTHTKNDFSLLSEYSLTKLFYTVNVKGVTYTDIPLRIIHVLAVHAIFVILNCPPLSLCSPNVCYRADRVHQYLMLLDQSSLGKKKRSFRITGCLF